jgi:hypothetical protein
MEIEGYVRVGNSLSLTLISGFRRNFDEISALLGHYAASYFVFFSSRTFDP